MLWNTSRNPRLTGHVESSYILYWLSGSRARRYIMIKCFYTSFQNSQLHRYIDPKTNVNANIPYWGNINAIFLKIQLWFIAIDKKENEECIGIIFSIFKTKHEHMELRWILTLELTDQICVHISSKLWIGLIKLHLPNMSSIWVISKIQFDCMFC